MATPQVGNGGTSINTHTVGQTLPVADWNNVAGALNAVNPSARVYLTSTYSPTTGSYYPTGTFGATGSPTAGGFTVAWQNGSMTATTSAVITAPVAGIYLVEAGWTSSNSVGSGGSLFQIGIQVAGTNVALSNQPNPGTGYMGIQVKTLVNITTPSTQTITFGYYVTAGSGNLTFASGQANTYLSAVLVG